MTDAVKPCPFCGSAAALLDISSEAYEKALAEHVEFKWFVACCQCDGKTDMYLKPEWALDKWNRRTPPAGWKPKETAPKDGSSFIAYGSYLYPGDKSKTEYYSLMEYGANFAAKGFPWLDEEGAHPDGFFSHWMPLPAAPENKP